MTNKVMSIRRLAERPVVLEQPVGGLRFDWMMVALSGGLVGGAYIDAWAHEHGKVDNSFFTPWHGILYSAMLIVALFLTGTLLRNRLHGYSWRRALPVGYGLSLLGVLVFSMGGVGDMIWHILFGVEANLEPLLSPTHLVLALGWILIVGGPLRASWQRADDDAQGWMGFPKVFALTYVLSVLTFFTIYANPFVHTLPARTWPDSGEVSQSLGVTAFLIQPALLMGIVLFGLRRWTLPFGTLTVMLLINTALLSLLHDQYVLIPSAVFAGLLADGLLRLLRSSAERLIALRLFALTVPMVLYGLYFLTLLLTSGVAWSTPLWAGSIMLAGVVGVLLSYVAAPPPAPGDIGSEQQLS